MKAGNPYLPDAPLIGFPDPAGASPEGIVAVGGELSPAMLLSAYHQGIFPWFSDDDPLLWWSPDPRCLLEPGGFHCSRRLARTLRQGRFRVTLDRDFAAVMEACAAIPRRHEEGTWITPEMREAYGELHRLGFAHSVEVWSGGGLAGGLYGVSLGRAFFGESMFSRERDASKAALAVLSRVLGDAGFRFIDCQIYTPHLGSLGAFTLPRRDFLSRLQAVLAFPSWCGSWSAAFTGDTAEILQ